MERADAKDDDACAKQLVLEIGGKWIALDPAALQRDGSIGRGCANDNARIQIEALERFAVPVPVPRHLNVRTEATHEVVKELPYRRVSDKGQGQTIEQCGKGSDVEG